MMFSPSLLLAKFGFHLAILAGVSVAYFAWHKTIQTKAVTAEKVRVEVIGNKIDAKAQTARRDAERKPHDSLKPYYRD